MIINIRGTNGSGKTTIAEDLIKEYGPAKLTSIQKSGKQILATFLPSAKLMLIGPYPGGCRGCDRIKTQDEVCNAVEVAARYEHNVLFDGVLVSTLYSRYAALATKLKNRIYVWAYLDTPEDICIKRIYARNGGKPFKEQLIRDKIRSIESTRRKAIAAGFDVFTIPYQTATAFTKELLGL